LEDGLDREADRHLVADDSAAVGPSIDAEVAAVDIRGRGEAGPVAAVRVRADPVASTASGTCRVTPSASVLVTRRAAPR